MRVLPVCVLALAAGCLATTPAVAAAPSATSAPAATAAAAQQKMTIVDFKFASPAVKLSVGDTMTWTNDDRAPHDVQTTKAPVKLQSPLLTRGQSWRHTFKVAGVYDYICSIHPEMKAVVDVAAAKPVTAGTTTTAKTAKTAKAKATGATSAAKSVAEPTAKKPAPKKPADGTAAVKAEATEPATAEEAIGDAKATVEAASATAETDSPATGQTAARAAAETENLALTANARQLESVRQWGAVLVGVALASLLIVGLHGGSARTNSPKPEWAGAVGVSASRHVRRPPRS